MSTESPWRAAVITPQPELATAIAEVIRSHGFTVETGASVERDWSTIDFALVTESADADYLAQRSNIVVEHLAACTPCDVNSALAEVHFRLVARNVDVARERFVRDRPVIGAFSFEDLRALELLVPAPFNVESGLPAAGMPFVSPSAEPSYVRSALSTGRHVLLTGPPGSGKSTACLQALFAVTAGALPVAVVYVRGRDLRTHDDDIDGAAILLRAGVTAGGRPTWPVTAPIRQAGWTVIVDGLDEWQTSPEIRVAVVAGLKGSTEWSLVSCRQHEVSRELRRILQYFDSIVRLTDWARRDIDRYISQLRRAGRDKAARYIEKRVARRPALRALQIPLWLSMLAYLAETHVPSQAIDEYELVIDVSTAIADAELRRAGAASTTTPDILQNLWSDASWHVHKARRDGVVLTLDDLALAIDCARGTPVFQALRGMLDISMSGRLQGFYHEVFLEFHLARHTIRALQARSSAVIDILSYQRSVITNQFIRAGLKTLPNRAVIFDYLTTKLSEALPPDRSDFAKSQIVYFLSRADDRAGTVERLASIWRTDASLFVRHSAAWGAVMRGVRAVEMEYYDKLCSSELDAKSNRGYHQSYYGDLPSLNERDVPVYDNGGSAEVSLVVLFDRIVRDERRHQYLRRIELATIRQFLQTGRSLPVEITDPAGKLDVSTDEVRNHEWGSAFVEGVRAEVNRIKPLLPSPPRQCVTLVLRGGGVKGLAFCGALDVLERYYDFDTFIGTSAGALTAILLSAGYSAQELKAELQKVDLGSFLEASFLRSLWNLLTQRGMHTGERIVDWLNGLLSKKLGREIVYLRDLPKRVVMLASMLGYGCLKFDSQGERRDQRAAYAARCSMAHPVVFTPGVVDGARVWDGGVLNNFPVEQLHSLGNQPFIALYLGTVAPQANRQFWPLDVFRLWLGQNEKALVDEHRENVVVIDPAPVRTTDFRLKEAGKRLLFARGRLAALEFMQRQGRRPLITDEEVESARIEEKEATRAVSSER
jgi:predicted acylesterase/phospholipase RssA